MCDAGSITIDHVRICWKYDYDEIKKRYGRQSKIVKSNGTDEYSLEKINGVVYLVHKNKNDDKVVNWAKVCSKDFDTYGD